MEKCGIKKNARLRRSKLGVCSITRSYQDPLWYQRTRLPIIGRGIVFDRESIFGWIDDLNGKTKAGSGFSLTIKSRQIGTATRQNPVTKFEPLYLPDFRTIVDPEPGKRHIGFDAGRFGMHETWILQKTFEFIDLGIGYPLLFQASGKVGPGFLSLHLTIGWRRGRCVVRARTLENFIADHMKHDDGLAWTRLTDIFRLGFGIPGFAREQ